MLSYIHVELVYTVGPNGLWSGREALRALSDRSLMSLQRSQASNPVSEFSICVAVHAHV